MKFYKIFIKKIFQFNKILKFVPSVSNIDNKL